MSDQDNQKENLRRRVVVEEVPDDQEQVNPSTEIKEKVEELQDITEHIAEDVKESSEVQKEIAEAVEKHEEFVAPKQAPDFNPLLIIIPGILLLGALLGGFVFYQRTMNSAPNEPVPTESSQNSQTASPSPSPTSTKTSLTKYAIAVKNGSGIAGEAGRAQTLIETEGFKVSGTGNADSYTYTKTVVKAKSTVEKDFLDALVKALGKNYQVDKTQTLAATSTDDVQIVVGSLKSAN